jgi:methionyl-tRNA formyltransferase
MSNNISGVKKKLNILFAGTPEFAAKILEDLLINFDNQFNLTAVYTQPDREAGRGRKLTPSAVKQLVLDKLINIPLNIPIEQPLDFKDPNTIEKLRSYQPDLIIVVAYGLILPQALLDIPTYGCINIHASLLPRWRGAAPIQRAILAGDVETGVCIQQMERGLDTGPVISSAKSLIDNNETTESLTNKLLQLAISLLNKYLKNLLLSHINPAQYSFQQAIPQDHSYATYAHKLTKAESIIDWTQSAELIYRKIRALNPWPSVTTNLNNINIHSCL